MKEMLLLIIVFVIGYEIGRWRGIMWCRNQLKEASKAVTEYLSPHKVKEPDNEK